MSASAVGLDTVRRISGDITVRMSDFRVLLAATRLADPLRASLGLSSPRRHVPGGATKR
jgi:hypothetical protein